MSQIPDLSRRHPIDLGALRKDVLEGVGNGLHPIRVHHGNRVGEIGSGKVEGGGSLFDARAGAPFTIHLTYPIETIDRAREADWNKERTKEIGRKRRHKQRAVCVREDWSPERHGLKAFFSGGRILEGQTILVASGRRPHLIELDDQLGY